MCFTCLDKFLKKKTIGVEARDLQTLLFCWAVSDSEVRRVFFCHSVRQWSVQGWAAESLW